VVDTEVPGIVDASFSATVFAFNGRNSKAYSINRDTHKPAFSGLRALAEATGYVANPVAGGVGGGGGGGTEFKALLSDTFNGGETWFEHVHVLSREYAFGNILATITSSIHFHNAYRRQTVSLVTFTNNAGVGLDIPQVTPPDLIPPSSSFLKTGSTVLAPLGLDLVVTTEGAPHFDTTLDFLFDTGALLIVPVSGDRIALFPIEFEGDSVDERLIWGTDVIPNMEGPTQRIMYRKNPRQVFEAAAITEGRQRRELQNLLMAWQGRSFGVPLWHDRMLSTAAVILGATTIPAVTDFVDLRVGGLLTVFTDSRTFDVVAVDSFSPTSIIVSTPLSRAYAAGTILLPTRIGRLVPNVSGRRYPVNAESHSLRFAIDDNDVPAAFASAAAFSSFGGKPLLDDRNMIDGTSMGTQSEMRVHVIDNESGTVYQTSDWPVAQRLHSKGFKANTRQRLYQVRQLLHYLRGRQRTFWIPTFIEDLLVTQTLTSGTALMDVENVGYTRFVQSRQPRATFRITFTDASTLTRTVLSSVELSATEERLTVDANWPSTKTAAQVTRVEFLEEVRLDSDEVVIRHRGIGRARIFVPVRVEP